MIKGDASEVGRSARSHEPITKVVRDSGKVRYLVRADVGINPGTGRRRQRRAAFDTLKEARSWLAEVRSATDRGTYADTSRLTVGEYLDDWLGGRLNIRPSTRRSYRDALRPFRERVGAVPLPALTRRQVEQVRDALLSGELRSTGRRGAPLAPRTVRLSLQALQTALDAAVRDELIPRNVAALVERPRGLSKPGAAWSLQEAERFAAAASTDRLHAAWLLSLHGLRRGEVLGLEWSAIDWGRRSLAITQARVSVSGTVHVSDPKTSRGRRELPLTEEIAAALRDLKVTQAAERRAAGQAHQPSSYVIVDEIGRPLRPEAYSDAFTRLARRAEVPLIRLHDARHTSVTLKRSQGWPDHLVALWHGHDESVMRATYTHSYLEDLRRQACGRRHGL